MKSARFRITKEIHIIKGTGPLVYLQLTVYKLIIIYKNVCTHEVPASEPFCLPHIAVFPKGSVLSFRCLHPQKNPWRNRLSSSLSSQILRPISTLFLLRSSVLALSPVQIQRSPNRIFHEKKKLAQFSFNQTFWSASFYKVVCANGHYT